MKKIMFSDEFMLTKAVLEGRKTQTRRIITHPKTFHEKDVCGFYVCRRVTDGAVTEVCMYDENESFIDEGQILPKYKVGEVVAVAQGYRDCDGVNEDGMPMREIISTKVGGTNAGWDNKMFVRGDLMPHQIRITNVRVERLQDISENDAIAEGIVYAGLTYEDYGEPMFVIDGCKQAFGSAKDAYAWLIDKISGKEIWQSNPYVFVYDFELVK